MSHGNTRPLAICDHDCAVVNDCQVGGCQCDGCGLWFCSNELERIDDGHFCEDCADEYRKEQKDDGETTEP